MIVESTRRRGRDGRLNRHTLDKFGWCSEPVFSKWHIPQKFTSLTVCVSNVYMRGAIRSRNITGGVHGAFCRRGISAPSTVWWWVEYT
jgi:hypothetical protein